jgi:hypothetical protein
MLAAAVLPLRTQLRGRNSSLTEQTHRSTGSLCPGSDMRAIAAELELLKRFSCAAEDSIPDRWSATLKLAACRDSQLFNLTFARHSGAILASISGRVRTHRRTRLNRDNSRTKC